MKYLLSLCIYWIAFGYQIFGQEAERKIIIQNGKFYYQTIDLENQLATMHVGKINQAISKAQNYPLPFGRNYDDPINPFVWDISENQLFALNFLHHPLNDWNEAIKKVAQKDIMQAAFKNLEAFELISLGYDNYMWTPNIPCIAMRADTNYFEQFYYDAILTSDTTLWIMYANLGKYNLWYFDNQYWHLISDGYFDFDQPFTLINLEDCIAVITNDQYFFIQKENGKKSATHYYHNKNSDNILVEDRDNKKLYTISPFALNTEIDFAKLLKSKGILLEL